MEILISAIYLFNKQFKIGCAKLVVICYLLTITLNKLANSNSIIFIIAYTFVALLHLICVISFDIAI